MRNYKKIIYLSYSNQSRNVRNKELIKCVI